MKATCPNNSEHKEFFTTAHIAQTWKVDKNGNFIEVASDDETVAGPNTGNSWTCVICNDEAIVKD